MSESVGEVGVMLNPVSVVAASAVNAGQLLRSAREATGLHVAALAVALKVPVVKLEALESGRIDLLPDVTFARALAASVCRNLKIDPAPVLAHFPPTGVSRLGADVPSINTPYRPEGVGPRLSFRGNAFSPLLLAVVALLVGAMAVALWPASAELGPEPVAVLTPGAELTDNPVPAQPIPSVSESVAPGVAAIAPLVEPVVPVAPVTAPLAPVVAEGQPMVLTAQAESWVKVTDAKGVVNLGRILKAGESVEVTGPFPMAVVVGRVDAVQLQVHGQLFDMAAFPKDRVARFEVK